MKVNQQIQEPIEEEQSSFEMQGKFSSSSLVKHQESNLSQTTATRSEDNVTSDDIEKFIIDSIEENTILSE